MALTEQAHQLIHEHFSDKPKRLAIDATCGNGYDTEFLLHLGFDRVLAFDIQQLAIDTTRDRVKPTEVQTLDLILDDHQNMAQYFQEQVDCVMFNLGYLPKADKKLTTQTESTLTALRIAQVRCNKNGMITILCYPGHPSGKAETEAVKQWITSLNDDWVSGIILSQKPSPTTPLLLWLKKIS